MDNTTALNITTVAIERVANALPEPNRESVLEAAKHIRQWRSSLLATLDQEACSQRDE